MQLFKSEVYNKCTRYILTKQQCYFICVVPFGLQKKNWHHGYSSVLLPGEVHQQVMYNVPILSMYYCTTFIVHNAEVYKKCTTNFLIVAALLDVSSDYYLVYRNKENKHKSAGWVDALG